MWWGGGGIKAKVFEFFGSYLVSSISAQYNFFCGAGGVDFFFSGGYGGVCTGGGVYCFWR